MSTTASRLAAIALGGALGALLRYGVTILVHGRLASGRLFGASFPWGTVAVNLSGCLAIGVVAGLFQRRLFESPQLGAFLLIGVLGSYTTFSTFAFETLGLFRQGSPGLALLNGLGSPMLGLLGVWLGDSLSRLP